MRVVECIFFQFSPRCPDKGPAQAHLRLLASYLGLEGAAAHRRKKDAGVQRIPPDPHESQQAGGASRAGGGRPPLIRRLWPRQLVRFSVRSSPQAAVHLAGSSSSPSLLVLLRRQPLDGGSSIPIPSGLLVSLFSCSCPSARRPTRKNWHPSLLT
jgi:hypothetical protein